MVNNLNTNLTFSGVTCKVYKKMSRYTLTIYLHLGGNIGGKFSKQVF